MKRKDHPGVDTVFYPEFAFGTFISIEAVHMMRQQQKIEGPHQAHIITKRWIRTRKSLYVCRSVGYCKHQTVKGYCLTKGHPERKNCQFCDVHKRPAKQGRPKTRKE